MWFAFNGRFRRSGERRASLGYLDTDSIGRLENMAYDGIRPQRYLSKVFILDAS
jgi:hypothetical protein